MRGVTARLWPAAAALALGLLAATPAAADTAWVIDQLQVGVHEGPERDSPVLALIPSATTLEVLEQRPGRVRVRTPAGLEGWVDADFVTAEMPAELVVAELEAWKRTRQEELAAAWAEVESLRAELQQAASAAAGGPAAQEVAEGRDQVDGGLRELQRLQEENRELHRRLARTTEALQAAEAQAPTAMQLPPEGGVLAGLPEDGLPGRVAAWARSWIWVAVPVAAGLLLLLGLGAGAWLADRAQRRRHGGFRL